MIRVPLTPAPGLITDDTNFSGPNRCVDMDKTRWKAGKPEPIGGWVKFIATQLSGVCRGIMTWYDLSSSLNIALGTSAALYVQVDGSLNEITPAGLPVGAADSAPAGAWGSGEWGDGYWGEGSVSSNFLRTWSFDNWGENLIANPRGGTIYLWDNNPANNAVPVTNAPSEVNTILVTPERQVLAVGCSEEISGIFNPLAVRGCKSEDLSDWTTNADDNVFEDTLSGGGSRLVSASMIGSYVAAWTDEGLFLGQFVGTVEQTYQWELQGTSCGLIGPNAFIVVNKRAYWMTPDLQFYTWAPGENPNPIACPIRNELLANLLTSQADKIVATSLGRFGEILWFYPDMRDGAENSRYVAFTTDVGAGQPVQWAKGTLARTAAIDAGAVPQPLFVSPEGYVYSHEDGNTADGGPLSGYWEMSLPYLDEGGQFVKLDGIEADFKDQTGAITMELTLRKYPQSTTRTGYKSITIPPNVERRHFQVSGRCGELKMSWESSPAFHRLGKPILTGVVTGRQ